LHQYPAAGCEVNVLSYCQIAAILVFALVGVRGEKALPQIAVHEMQLQPFETGKTRAFGGGG
jgi:hypothetical protein